MDIEYSKGFTKAMKGLPQQKRKLVAESIKLWVKEPTSPRLRRHDLKGEYAGQFSISAGGDLRVHMQWIVVGELVEVTAVGTHSQLYG